MTVGQIAKKMGVTARTLQYYDKEGVLSPSSQSEGGRRLYTDKDIVKLHQILSMKYLGFSLADIKDRLISLDTPGDIADALAEHAAAIRQKIDGMSESLRAVEALRVEALQMHQVDFRKYADIIVNLRMKNDMYWVIKHVDDDLMEYFRNRFDKEGAHEIMTRFSALQSEAARLKKNGAAPESKEGQDFAEAFWEIIMEFTDGDMSLLPRLMELSDKADSDINDFIGPALDAYFDKSGLSTDKKEETN